MNFSDLLDKWYHPKREEQEQLRDRIKELQELSRLALEIDNQQIYRNLQIESNELFMKYLTYMFFDGLRFIVPHLFLLAVITTKISFVSLPVSLPGLGSEIPIVLVYPVVAIIFYILRKKFKNRKVQLSNA
ncbi:hypothetical protein [Desulfallas thermosapovorans]|uniref:Uncharacterized protein n=1 Tax=Desulfallas thermosapovorans DSM 6562 TaxID=1121431 RepID=A0A5S4ZWM3_9FIRM|nr:hypothetical protein [Desulfallas thermosapovorans]TYO97209.1 hypothetical protein LX24_00392 [Desulfallas thermosapovorans DSM 6562]